VKKIAMRRPLESVGVWLLTETAAQVLHVHPRTIRRMAEAGDLVGVKFRGCLRIREDSLTSYVHRQVEKYREDNGID
jgi:excisionase family DNA binding protein